MKRRFASEFEVEELLVVNDLQMVGNTILDRRGVRRGQMDGLMIELEERRWWPVETGLQVVEGDTEEIDVAASARSRLARLSRSYRAA